MKRILPLIALVLLLASCSKEPPADQIKGIRVCRQAKAAWVDSLERRTDPIGRPYWWMTGKFVCDNPPHDTDQYFLSQGYVSVVPIRPDFTDTQALQNIQYFEK